MFYRPAANVIILIMLAGALLPFVQPAEGLYIEKFEMNIGDRWNYRVDYQNVSLYVEVEVEDEGIVTALDQVKEVWVLRQEFLFGEIDHKELPGLTYEASFHQNLYVDKENLEVIRTESFLKADITLLIFKGSFFVKEVIDYNYWTGIQYPIEPGSSFIHGINEYTQLNANSKLSGLGENFEEPIQEEYNISYENNINCLGPEDVSTPAGNFKTQIAQIDYGAGLPVAYIELQMVLEIIMGVNTVFDQIFEDNIDEPDIVEWDYEDHSRKSFYSERTKLPARFVDYLGGKTFWTWTLIDYEFVEVEEPIITLRSYYYFISFGIIGALVAAILIANLVVRKGKPAKKDAPGWMKRIEELLETGIAAPAVLQPKKKSDYDDEYDEYEPDHGMQRDLYESRGFGKKADNTYDMSPREQRDLYEQFGRRESTRNIFDEDYEKPAAPDDKWGKK